MKLHAYNINSSISNTTKLCTLDKWLDDNGFSSLNDTTIRDFAEYTPLHLAAENNDVSMCNLLVDSGIDVDIRNNENLTPLHMASCSGAAAACVVLIDHGADVNSKGGRNNALTPLHWATIFNSPTACEILIKNGADINSKASDGGQTPLHFAVSLDSVQACGVLLKHGADELIKDDSGKTPQDLMADAALSSIVLRITNFAQRCRKMVMQKF